METMSLPCHHSLCQVWLIGERGPRHGMTWNGMYEQAFQVFPSWSGQPSKQMQPEPCKTSFPLHLSSNRSPDSMSLTRLSNRALSFAATSSSATLALIVLNPSPYSARHSTSYRSLSAHESSAKISEADKRFRLIRSSKSREWSLSSFRDRLRSFASLGLMPLCSDGPSPSKDECKEQSGHFRKGICVRG